MHQRGCIPVASQVSVLGCEPSCIPESITCSTEGILWARVVHAFGVGDMSVPVALQQRVQVLGRAVCQLARAMEISVPNTPVASFIAVTIASLPQLAAIQVCCRALHTNPAPSTCDQFCESDSGIRNG